jgi:LPXTG-motif cell wall-anchored protein
LTDQPDDDEHCVHAGVSRRKQTSRWSHATLLYEIRIPSGIPAFGHDRTPGGSATLGIQGLGENMDTNTLLIIVVVLLLAGGGGFFYRRRA